MSWRAHAIAEAGEIPRSWRDSGVARFTQRQVNMPSIMPSFGRELRGNPRSLQPRAVVVAKGSEEPERFSILVPKAIVGRPGPRWIESKEMDEAELVKRLEKSRFSQLDISKCLQLARDRFSAERGSS